ncbi:DUF397 domain-containing protein [Nonomuraea sp. NPDC049750]
MNVHDDLAAELAAATWRKATKSGANGGDCIEIAPLASIFLDLELVG